MFADGEDDVVFHVGEAVAVGDALEFKEFVHGEFQAGNAAGSGFGVSVEGVDAVEEEFQELLHGPWDFLSAFPSGDAGVVYIE